MTKTPLNSSLAYNLSETRHNLSKLAQTWAPWKVLSFILIIFNGLNGKLIKLPQIQFQVILIDHEIQPSLGKKK